MTRKTHSVVAVLSAVIISQNMDLPAIDCVCGALCTAMLPDADQDTKCLRHRGQTHSFVWPVILYMISRCVIDGKYIVLGMSVGWLSHVLIDLLNGKGCELFWPLSDKNIRLMDIKYDGRGEGIIFVLAVVGIIVSVVGVGNIRIIAEVLK